MSHPLDWLLLGRYALLVSLCDLIPVPILDGWVANVLRRRLVRAQLEARGIELPDAEVRILGNAVSGGCVGCLWSAFMWPIKKLLKTVVIVFTVKGIADTVSEVVHRGLLLEEALDDGWIPGDTERVRAAMDSALAHVDTRLVERVLRGTLRDSRHDLNEAIFAAVRLAREQRSHPAQALADAAEADRLGAGANRVSRSMTAALEVSGLVPELIQWFRAEMEGAPVDPLAEVVEAPGEGVTRGAGGEE